MAISLSKGSTISLTKEAGPIRLTNILVGLGWTTTDTPGVEFDLDASALVLGQDGRVLSQGDFVFYGQEQDSSGAVRTLGDNLVGGDGQGDDEQITIDLDKLPQAAQRVLIAVSIYEGEKRGQNFGLVGSAFIRVVNAANGQELARFDLTSGASSETAFAFGELYRDGAEWRFGAVGDAYQGGLGGLVSTFGVNVG